MLFTSKNSADRFASIARVIQDAGGSIVGRTRLQKTVYLLKVAGYDEGFDFRYKHYGPFSDRLAEDATIAAAFGHVTEESKRNKSGENYFQYRAQGEAQGDGERVELTKVLANADAVALELAATAVYLHLDGYADAWKETAERKPDKVVGGRLEAAKKLYEQVRAFKTPEALPQVN